MNNILIAVVILLFGIVLPITADDFPEKVYLPVPFICQAPSGDWSRPWQDACEEAAIVMGMNYVQGRISEGEESRKGRMGKDILDLINFQLREYGRHKDLTAQESAQLIKDYYHYQNVLVKEEATIMDIKNELAVGKVVIAPMAGRLLCNPYYTPPGPAYHYLLFKGYDDATGEFITNDAGTKRGRNYRYMYKVAYNAIHDWTGEKSTVEHGKKVVIILSPVRY
jgi:hypothetical protein